MTAPVVIYQASLLDSLDEAVRDTLIDPALLPAGKGKPSQKPIDSRIRQKVSTRTTTTTTNRWEKRAVLGSRDDVNNHGGVSINIRCVKIIPLLLLLLWSLPPIRAAPVSHGSADYVSLAPLNEKLLNLVSFVYLASLKKTLLEFFC